MPSKPFYPSLMVERLPYIAEGFRAGKYGELLVRNLPVLFSNLPRTCPCPVAADDRKRLYIQQIAQGLKQPEVQAAYPKLFPGSSLKYFIIDMNAYLGATTAEHLIRRVAEAGQTALLGTPPEEPYSRDRLASLHLDPLHIASVGLYSHGVPKLDVGNLLWGITGRHRGARYLREYKERLWPDEHLNMRQVLSRAFTQGAMAPDTFHLTPEQVMQGFQGLMNPDLAFRAGPALVPAGPFPWADVASGTFEER